MRLLFARHHLRVFRFLTRIVKNEATAEDLLNEVFLDVWRGARGFEARSQVTTWILGIARFKALSALRRARSTPLDDEVAEGFEDPADDPEVAMQKTDRSAMLQDCLNNCRARIVRSSISSIITSNRSRRSPASSACRRTR